MPPRSSITRRAIQHPGLLGIVTDLPPGDIPDQAAVLVQDMLTHFGVVKARRGWVYDGTTADSSTAIASVMEQRFRLAQVTATATATAQVSGVTNLLLHNPSSAGTALGSVGGSTDPQILMFAGSYRDEALFDTSYGLLRWSGASSSSSGSASATTFNAGKATITGGTLDVPKASYWSAACTNSSVRAPTTYHRVLDSSSGSQTLENVLAANTTAPALSGWGLVGFTYPCVAIYDTGTLSITANVATGTGTKWSTSDPFVWHAGRDAILLTPASGNRRILYTGGPSSDTSMQLFCPNTTETKYKLMHGVPASSVASHRGSLFAAGNTRFPNRVWVGPPGWDLSVPPGVTGNYDPTVEYATPNNSDYELDYVDVPALYDGDPITGVMSSPAGLLVVKRGSVWIVNGSWPSLSVNLVDAGNGGFATMTAEEGQFWAGENGVFQWTGDGLRNLTAGRVGEEWRAFTATATPGATMGVCHGHLLVSVTDGSTTRVYGFHLRTGAVTRHTNIPATVMFSSQVSGKQARLLAAGSPMANGRVADLAPMFASSGTYTDPAGTGPTPVLQTGMNLDGGDGSSPSRMLDLEASLVWADSAGTSLTNVRHDYNGSYGADDGAASSHGLDVIASTSLANNQPRWVRLPVNREGRRHGITFNGRAATATQAPLEVHELTATFRPTRVTS